MMKYYRKNKETLQNISLKKFLFNKNTLFKKGNKNVWLIWTGPKDTSIAVNCCRNERGGDEDYA